MVDEYKYIIVPSKAQLGRYIPDEVIDIEKALVVGFKIISKMAAGDTAHYVLYRKATITESHEQPLKTDNHGEPILAPDPIDELEAESKRLKAQEDANKPIDLDDIPF
jgi:hypothetical protein